MWKDDQVTEAIIKDLVDHEVQIVKGLCHPGELSIKAK